MHPPTSSTAHDLARRPELRAPEGTALYVHLPFCVTKCTYCDFYSVVSEGQDLGGTLEALIAEARRHAPWHPRTVFLGGGTPSLYAAADLTHFLDELHACTGFRDSAVEVTAECNPESLDLEKARAMRAGGVDRLTLGFQSLDPDLLQLFGRAHTVEQSYAAFEAARGSGCTRLGVDLIYAAPGQVLEGWLAHLSQVLALEPEHLSAYTLAFEEGTTFSRWLENGTLEALGEDEQLAFFHATRRLATAKGLAPYEISNFALDGEQCLHNVNYWRNGPYLGIGPSAVSKIGLTRFANPRSVVEWRAGIEAAPQSSGLAWEETLDGGGRLGETWWLGLRLAAGVVPATARLTAGWPDAPDPADALAKELAADGWLERVGEAWTLSAAGLPLADAIAARFLRRTSEACAGGTSPQTGG